MTKRDAIKFFGNKNRLANALSIHRSAVTRWGERVPLRQAMKLAMMTNHKLRCDMKAYL